MGPHGHVLALEQSPAYVEEARAAARREQLPWLEVRRHDLARDSLAPTLMAQRLTAMGCEGVGNGP